MNRSLAAVMLCFLLPFAGSIAAAQNAEGIHDMLLMLPDGPIQFRIRITDAGKPLKQQRDDYLKSLIASLDTDMDGKLSREETSKHPLFVSGRRMQNNPFLDSLRARRPYSDDELSLAIDRAAGQLLTYRQNNAMADQDLSVFRVLDSDESGLIDRVEMRLAVARIAERDLDFDQCVTFDEFLDNPATSTGLAVVSSTEPPTAVHSDMLRDASEAILAARLVRRYDTDRDAHLTAKELGWTDKRISVLDIDADARLSMQEISKVATMTPDLAMEVELAKPASEAMTVVGEPSEFVKPSRPDLIRFAKDGLSLSISYQSRDPMNEAVTNASLAFNAIDVDANGYLDRDEIAEHQRFERYLFDAMDRDGDDRVFAEEMMTYVKEYTEPASTSCQVTLLDTGNGFFQILDANADGRISIRELRKCEDYLLSVAKDEEINPSRLTKSYRIEIKRGGVSLFGRVDRPTVETPEALLKPPSGPMWFQRMDRNGDGDLTWDEFLGPRDVFATIDADGDDLIDEAEATEVK